MLQRVVRVMGLTIAACLGGPALGQDEAYVAAVWDDQSVHVLNSNLDNVRSFSVPVELPNGIATDGDTVWVGFFVTAEVIAFDMTGQELFRWSGPFGNLQGMELVEDQIAIANAESILFFDAQSGQFDHAIPCNEGSNVEGIAYDGEVIWLLADDIVAVDPGNGNEVRRIANAAIGCSFGGTGITASGPDELTLGCAEGNWFRVRSSDGGVIAQGGNGLSMFGLKSLLGGGSKCQYTVRSSKAKGGCRTCPDPGDNFETQSRCEDVRDCRKKVKTTISCPEGPGTCKVKAKRRACE